MWHVLLKNVNYLNTISQKDQIDQNLTKIKLNWTQNENKDKFE